MISLRETPPFSRFTLRQQLQSREGVTVPELVVYMGLVAIVTLWAAYFMRVPTQMNRLNQQTLLEQNLDKALVPLENDMREADALSLAAIPCYGIPCSLTLSQGSSPVTFTRSTLSGGYLTVSSSMAYAISSSYPAALARTELGPGTTQYLFIAATSSVTLKLTFVKYTNPNYVDIKLTHTAPGNPSPVITIARRRVALRS